MRSQMLFLLLMSCIAFVASATVCEATLPPEVRKELSELKDELRPVAGLIRKKDVAAAKAIIQKVEDRLVELAIPEDERDRNLSSLRTQLERAKASIPISFEREIAPILKDNCLRCHGPDRAAAQLRMDTFNNMARGSQHGPLAVAGNPGNSRIIFRLTVADEQQRMPRNDSALPAEQIALIARWIAGGADFDGENRDAPIGESAAPKKPEVKIVMADGSETVSFRDDIAPILVNICQNCHRGNNPRGGYSMATFESVLMGGDTGSTIIPGKPDESYIVDLTLRQDPIKMPAGQARLKRSQAQAIATWVAEGAHFDGTDPKAPLQSLVPTADEVAAARLSAMSDDEFRKRRTEQAAAIWKRVAPRETARSATTENLFVHGSVPQERIDQISRWGEEQVAQLQEKYPLPDQTQPWRGRLIVFVTSSRFDYEEFNTVLLDRRTPPAVSGHVHLTANLDDAYVVMHDVGDAENSDALTARELLSSVLAQAWLERDGTSLPDWLREGFGLMESGASAGAGFLKAAPARAATALATLDDPRRVFENGTFAPEDVTSVGYLVTRFLVTQGGAARFRQLVQALRNGDSASKALEEVYGQDAASLGRAFLQNGGR
ncbi:MAG: c-type cytochrome domain-containing protein [Planctomycetaceae bacterium]